MILFASIPSPDISFFSIGPLRIHFYALFILAGIAAAVWLTSRRLTRRGGEPGLVLDIALWTVPLGIVGGRLYHVVTHPGDYFFPGADLWKALYVWEGGLAIFGAVLFGAAGAYIACRRSGLRFLSFADALAPGMLLAQAMGRLGNYHNHELFGAPTTLPWGLQIESTNPAFPAGLPAGTLFQPLFLYEILWNLFGVAVLLLVERQFNLRWGKAIGLYLLWYGIGRTWLEALRLDPTEFQLVGLKINMITAMVIALIGIVLIVVQSRRHPGPENSPYLPGRAWTPPTPGTSDPAPSAPAGPASPDGTGNP
ncbi:prolipoprotein diacylglyceryl transferase [Cryobacterium sp. MDB1-18-2]|uniref:prolipoprotein diacylglyceryl transferase n=1 Tax=unclassified Cryobacterium TaxID=2649013 RepID=UPI00106DCF61|nr:MULTISPECIES: prolipoprotein diacylglyceryl transferase [unclassified Cryobacterium]TFC30805.1 prolipoprotein diacylglyceryl transferase [Cryobacterium sp. MDB1-18-2]TFC38148.1 prolipoprotein diacylglyceryl transferase [Cryobacterium sp. MDB1-18-1]